ncbi:hypothetical protein FRC08_002710 [Ceratobasidium sp. 394]|nr:hypothetical protein FRC08_002710 [Ceratobasidium sp. 394]KAG9076119.1 hypothetical protein FS749_012141 [Ceratobasidium sp. UAMH 11750]
MSEPSASQGNNQIPAFSFQPPAGGDVTLKSSDGATFVVHSVLLAIASKVFSDMFTSSTIADVVELAEDAEAISLMLASMYPVIRPTIDTIPLLEKAMLVAQKYDIDILVKTLAQTNSHQRDIIRRDPLRVYCSARDSGFRETQMLAAKLVTRSHYDMLTPDGLLKFAREFPDSAHVIGIVGAQGMRAKVLERLCLVPSSIWPKTDSTLALTDTNYMICFRCWNGNAYPEYYRPGWLESWSRNLYSELTNKLLDECSSYFELACLVTLRRRSGICTACIDRTFTMPVAFDRWAKDTRLFIERELAPFDVLYTL